MTSTGSIILKRNKEEHLIFEIMNGFEFHGQKTSFEIFDAKGISIHQEEVRTDLLNTDNKSEYDFPIHELGITGKFRLLVWSTVPVENFLIQLSKGQANFLSAVLF